MYCWLIENIFILKMFIGRSIANSVDIGFWFFIPTHQATSPALPLQMAFTLGFFSMFGREATI